MYCTITSRQRRRIFYLINISVKPGPETYIKKYTPVSGASVNRDRVRRTISGLTRLILKKRGE